MAIRFVPVAELTAPLNITVGISGGSGTGKTYTALLMARGLAETKTGKKGAPIGYVDTEGKRALHYRDTFPEMMHFDFETVDDSGEMIGFPPERWISVIDAAEAAGLPVLILDSMSHAWEGVGGVLDLQAQALDGLVQKAEQRNQRYNNTTPVDPDKFSQLAWSEVKPRYRRLIDRIVRTKIDIIICTRAKPVMQKGYGDKATNARATKTRRVDVPWDPASDADLMFEMTAMVILDPKAPGCPVYQIKVADQFKGLFDPARPMGEHTGRAMAEWASGQGEAQKRKQAMDTAREIARGGTDAFRAWYSTTDKPMRATIKPIMEEIQALCTVADEIAAMPDDEPFAPDPTETDRGEAQATNDAEADIMQHLARKTRVTDVDSLVASRMGELDEAGQQRLRDAAQVQRDNLLGGGK
jgi:hypothetical protein